MLDKYQKLPYMQKKKKLALSLRVNIPSHSGWADESRRKKIRRQQSQGLFKDCPSGF